MKKLLQVLLAVNSLLLSLSDAHAQEAARVRGTVFNEQREALPGVNIRIKDQSRGATTDNNGRFSLSAPPGATLVFSYQGYETQELRADPARPLEVVLEAGTANLEEVVVLGYGTVRKKDLTGAVTSLKLQDPDKQRVISVPEAIQGKVAGVQIMNNSGEPGSGMTFRIRGATSVTGSNQPLIVIDGQPVESDLNATTAGISLDWMTEVPPSDPLATINPADIASIEILKDASATAIYGSRGANGVVLITTRSGSRKGKDRFSYNFRTDVSTIPRKIPMANAYEYMQYRNEASLNDGGDSMFLQKDIDSLGLLYGDVNWQDQLYRTAVSHDHQLSASGGNEKMNYLVSGNYTDQQSIIRNSGFKRGALRVNFDRQLTQRLRLGLRSSISFSNRDYGQQSNGQGNLASSVVMGALAFNPLRLPYTPDGDLDETLANNPILVTTLVDDKTQIRNLIANLSLDYAITPELSYQLRGGVNDIGALRQQYWPRGTFQGNSYQGSATRSENQNVNYLIDHILTFRKKFGQHFVNAVGGFSYQRWNGKAASQTSTGFPTDALGYNNFALAEKPGVTYTSNKTKSLASLLGRINYTLADRYLLTLTGRYDGSSRLADNRKWQFFPSVAVGWNVSGEPFFDPIKNAVSLLKLRASYGVSGNENVAIGATRSNYSINYAVINQSITSGFTLDNFDNKDLTWERTAQFNAGIDIRLLKDRLGVNVDYYRKRTYDLLINLALPASSTYTDYYTNLGELLNHGLDAELSYEGKSGGVQWNCNANISFVRNEVLDLGATDIIYGRSFINGGNMLLNQPLTAAPEGHPISSFWGYKTDGVYQNADEISKGPEAGVARPGDLRFVDVNGDGTINEADKTVIGNPNPDFTYGFGGSLSYKSFSFSFAFLGSQGNELINLNQWLIGSLNATGEFNVTKAAFEGRWREDGNSNLYPAPTGRSPRFGGRFPGYMVEDASFLRLQQAMLSYLWKPPVRWKISGIRLYVSGTNLFTITNYSGYDPNINGFGQATLLGGIDYGTLPQARTFSAGIELSW